MKIKMTIEVEVELREGEVEPEFRARWTNNKVSARVAQAIEQGALVWVTKLDTYSKEN